MPLAFKVISNQIIYILKLDGQSVNFISQKCVHCFVAVRNRETMKNMRSDYARNLIISSGFKSGGCGFSYA